MNIPRLTTDDVPLFSGVITDLFPLDEAPHFDYGVLLKAIEGELVRNGYQVSLPSIQFSVGLTVLAPANCNIFQATPKAILKVLELYETKNSRHSVMIVGRTGSGKSVTWKTLKDSLSFLNREGEPGFVSVKVSFIFMYIQK
jgi:dynein heavy chain